MVAGLRQLSDRKAIEAIQENRYVQYFCHVPDQGLLTFLHSSTLRRFRQRLGQEGIEVIEDQVFTHLKRAGAIKADMMLMDASVLESPIIYPNDVRLLYKAFGKLGQVAKQQHLPLWWDMDTLKSRWRAFNLSKAEERQSVFGGQSTDGDAAYQDACRKARAATEGFIAVAKHLRGFGCSLYRGPKGAALWTRVHQCAYNVKKFLQLYRNEALEERTLVQLRL